MRSDKVLVKSLKKETLLRRMILLSVSKIVIQSQTNSKMLISKKTTLVTRTLAIKERKMALQSLKLKNFKYQEG